MKTRSAKRKVVKNKSGEKISLQSIGDRKAQIEKVYAERGKSHDNNHSPVFNIHVHVTNSNKNSSNPSTVQPIIHLHIGEKELQKLSQKKTKSSPTKRVTRSSPQKRGRKRHDLSLTSPQESENKIVSNSDLKNYLITDYLTCSTPLSRKLVSKNINFGISLDSKSEISNEMENTKDVSNEISKKGDGKPSMQSRMTDESEENNENDSNAHMKSPSSLAVHDYKIKEVFVVLKDIDCVKNTYEKNCPNKVNDNIVNSLTVLKETNCIENESETLNQEISEVNQEEKKSKCEQDLLIADEGEVSITEKSQTGKNSCSRMNYYDKVYSSSEESGDLNNESRKELVEAVSPSANIVTTNEKQSDILNYRRSKKKNKSVRNNLEQKFKQVETQNEKITNEISSASENTSSQAEKLNVSQNSVKESDMSNEENCNGDEFDSDQEISYKNWSTESLNGYNFSEILQKLSGTCENSRSKDKIASPLMRKVIQSECDRLYVDEEKSDGKKEKENESESECELGKESCSEKKKIKNSTPKKCILPVSDKNKNFSSANNANLAESQVNFFNINNCNSPTAEFLSSESGETNVQEKKQSVTNKLIENDSSQSFQVNVEQTFKLDSDCNITNISDKFVEKEKIKVKQKKKKTKKNEEDEILVKKNPKPKALMNPFFLMDDNQVITSNDSCTRGIASTVSPVSNNFEEERNKIKKKNTGKSFTIDYFLKNSSEISQSSNKSKKNAEKANSNADLLTPKKVRKLSKEGNIKTNEFSPFDAEEKQDLKGDKVLCEASGGLENDNVGTNDSMCEEEPRKINESNSNLLTLNSQKDTLLASWSSVESLFREKVKLNKPKKKSKRKNSSKCTGENQIDCIDVNNLRDEQLSKTNRDSDDEPALVIDDLSESEVSFFFDEIDCPRKKKNKKEGRNEHYNFSPKSNATTCSTDMFLSQELNMEEGKEKEGGCTKRSTESAETHFLSTDTDRRMSKNIKKNLYCNLSPIKEKVHSIVEDKEIGKGVIEVETNIIKGSNSIAGEFVTNEKNEGLKFSPRKGSDGGTREEKLGKIKKWVQDNSSSPPVIIVDQNSPISESLSSFTRETKKKRKLRGAYFDEEKSTPQKKNKTKLARERVDSESNNNCSSSFEKTEKDDFPTAPDSGGDNSTYTGSCQITKENSEQCFTTQTKDLSFETVEKEKSSIPRTLVKVTKNQTDSGKVLNRVKKKKLLKSSNKMSKIEFIEPNSLDFQLDLINKEMNKRGIVKNKKKKKLNNEEDKKLAQENKVFSEDTIIEESKKRKKKKRNYELENSSPTKKTKACDKDGYIPLETEGPTKFSVAVLDKVKPIINAADFKHKMLFGDRVARFSKSNSLGVMKIKQKTTRAHHSGVLE